MIGLQLANFLWSRSHFPRYGCCVCDRYNVHATHRQAFNRGHSSWTKPPHSNSYSLISFLHSFLSQRYRSCLGGNVGALASILEPFASTAMDRNRNTLGIAKTNDGIIRSSFYIAYGEISISDSVEQTIGCVLIGEERLFTHLESSRFHAISRPWSLRRRSV